MGGISGVTNAPDGAQQLSNGTSAALINANTRFGVLDTNGLATDVADIAVKNPELAADVLEEISPRLSVADRQHLAQRVAEETDTAAANAQAEGASTQSLILDLTQIGLSIAGIFDPTPVSDGLDGVISLFRGDFLGAGISVVSMIPYVGDAAKLGKLPKFMDTIANAVDLAKVDPGFARLAKPAFEKIAGALDALPIDKLPNSAQDILRSMRAKLDEFLAPAAARGADEVVQLGRQSANVGRNQVDWTLDAQGRPVHAEAVLRETFPGVARTADETAAQGRVAAQGVAGDQGGHIIGHRFVPDQGDVNMFPQNGNFNQSAYKKMENEWAAWTDNGAEVRVRADLEAVSNGRPDRVYVEYDVVGPDGNVIYRNAVEFENAAGQTFDRVSSADVRAALSR